MRVRIITLIATALAAITFLAGCARNGANTNSTTTIVNMNAGTTANASPTATTPSPTTPVTVSASTPTETFNSYYEAIKRKDVNAFKSLFSKGTLSMLDDRAKRQNTTTDAVIKEGIEEASKEVPATLPPTRNEKIDGDKATLEVNDEKKEKWETLHFVREDGQWKISFDPDEAK
jgi:preprotein translocase subunit SecD